VNKLTDQNVLAKIAMEDEHLLVCRVAANKLTDRALLAKIGMWVKPELTRQVTDQALLAKIAVEAKDRDVRLAAVKRLTDQALLAELAMEDDERDVRCSAVQKLNDQFLLAKIAMEDKDSDVRLTGVQTLNDQTLLVKIGVEAKWLDIRAAAIGKVTDQTLLCQWAEKEPQAAIRQAAVLQIVDDSFLVQRLPTEPSAAVRTTIVETLHDKDSLRKVALTAYHEEDRKQALLRLQKALQGPAPDVVNAHQKLTRKVEVLANENNNGRLLTLVLEGEFDVLRAGAARRLSDPASLEQAALRATERDVLKILLAKIEESAMLNRIAAGATDLPMHVASAIKSGAKSWEQVFDAATAKGAAVQMLGDALAAVSLFPDVQQDAVAAVQQACLNLIRLGDESRIPEMVDLLEGYGDKTLAEDYLNCGQPDLDATARVWAQRRGYPVDKGAGSHRATWGTSR
jgi:hypothetical protein